jgi:hypothetical protein
LCRANVLLENDILAVDDADSIAKQASVTLVDNRVGLTGIRLTREIPEPAAVEVYVAGVNNTLVDTDATL